MPNVFIHCSAGRRGAGSVDCITCGVPIHQAHGASPAPVATPWWDGGGDHKAPSINPSTGRQEWHTHAPAKEDGPVLGPFEYIQFTYDTMQFESEILAVWDRKRGDWILNAPGEAYDGEAYSDLTIHTQEAS